MEGRLSRKILDCSTDTRKFGQSGWSPWVEVAHGRSPHILQGWVCISSPAGLHNWLGAACGKCGFCTNMVVDPEGQHVGLPVTF